MVGNMPITPASSHVSPPEILFGNNSAYPILLSVLKTPPAPQIYISYHRS